MREREKKNTIHFLLPFILSGRYYSLIQGKEEKNNTTREGGRFVERRHMGIRKYHRRIISKILFFTREKVSKERKAEKGKIQKQHVQ